MSNQNLKNENSQFDKDSIRREKRREYYRKNKEKILASVKNWQSRNKEKLSVYYREYYDRTLAAAGKARSHGMFREPRQRRSVKLENSWYSMNRDSALSKINKRRNSVSGEDYKMLLMENAISRTVRSGREYTISFDDVPWTNECPLCSSELIYAGHRKPPSNSPTIDRIDNSLGYVPGNVQVICRSCNCRKRDKQFCSTF